jgi:hypothetical protein
VPVRDGVRVEVFHGLEQRIRNAYVEDNIDEVKQHTDELIEKFEHRPREERMGFGFEREQTGQSLELRSVAPDGTAFELRLSPA